MTMNNLFRAVFLALQPLPTREYPLQWVKLDSREGGIAQRPRFSHSDRGSYSQHSQEIYHSWCCLDLSMELLRVVDPDFNFWSNPSRTKQSQACSAKSYATQNFACGFGATNDRMPHDLIDVVGSNTGLFMVTTSIFLSESGFSISTWCESHSKMKAYLHCLGRIGLNTCELIWHCSVSFMLIA